MFELCRARGGTAGGRRCFARVLRGGSGDGTTTRSGGRRTTGSRGRRALGSPGGNACRPGSSPEFGGAPVGRLAGPKSGPTKPRVGSETWARVGDHVVCPSRIAKRRPTLSRLEGPVDPARRDTGLVRGCSIARIWCAALEMSIVSSSLGTPVFTQPPRSA